MGGNMKEYEVWLDVFEHAARDKKRSTEELVTFRFFIKARTKREAIRRAREHFVRNYTKGQAEALPSGDK